MIDQRVKNIISDISKAQGEQFFPKIVQALATAIDADITFIATLDNEKQHATTIAVDVNGQLSDNISYALKQTPCENVANNEVCVHDLNVQQLYPDDELLKTMGAHSYIGVPLHNNEGQVIGLLAALYYQSLGSPEAVEALFLLFSGLIGVELDRREHMRDYQLASAVINNVNKAIVITDKNLKITYVNPAFETITGYSQKEAIGKNPKLLSSKLHSAEFYKDMWRDIKNNHSWSGEIINKKKDGSVYPEWLNINVIRDKNNAVINYAGFFSDISKSKKIEEELDFKTHYDTLTRLPNMEHFIHVIKKTIDESASKKFAIAIIDIDNFREINDSYGYVFGNHFLQQVSQRLSLSTHNQDTLSRFSGDQFPLLINNIESPIQASKTIDEIQQKLKQPFLIDGQEVNITSRAGVSIYPDDGNIAEQLVSYANQSLVYAKQQPESRSSFFAPVMRQLSERRMYLRGAIAKSIKQDNFTLAFQPIIDIKNKRIDKFEALLRLQYDGEWISPEEFIPVAEEFDLIKPLGKLVLEKSCQTLQLLRAAGHTTFCFAINRSVHEFPSPAQGAKHWLKTLKKYDIPAQSICFEITESVLAPDSKTQIDLLNDLKKSGCSLAIDDFGTGYSSLSYLRKFPIDILKIDRSFISDQRVEDNDWRLVSSIIAMAQALGQKTIAEGVETQEQLQQLTALGCDYIQGYLFSKPLPEKELIAYIDGFDFYAAVSADTSLWSKLGITANNPALSSSSIPE